MTAEAAVLNKSAVALAADSKATVRVDSSIKTHDTANKLFALSKHHPVGVMINGNSEFMSVPWETIIKIYRERLKKRCLPLLSEYADDVLLSLTVDYAHDEKSQASNALYIIGDLFETIFDRADELEKDRNYSRDEARDIALDSRARVLLNIPILPNFTNITAEELFRLYRNEIETVAAVYLENVQSEFRNKLIAYGAEALRRELFSESSSELVIAGFGDHQIFPALKSWTIDGVVANRVRSSVEHNVVISRDGRLASIIPFAQREMVDRFMTGIDPDYRRYLDRTYSRILQLTCDEIIDKYAGFDAEKRRVVGNEIGALIKEKLEEHQKTIAKYRREKFSDPIMDMAALLPKEELANLAESLVNLTSFKRRISLDQESVGGPIDVAVISKGDGFVWIKRKHYFKEELNPMFSGNFFREHIVGDGETANERRINQE